MQESARSTRLFLSPFVKHMLFAFMLAGVCYAAFFNGLHNDFMIDDNNVILWDSRGHNPLNLVDQFIPDYRVLRGMKDLASSQYFRPWAHIIPLASYAFFQKDPFGYHVFNLILFYLACLSIYLFIWILFKERVVAVLTTVLFAIHPINGLMVNYITASVFSFQIIMTMLGMVAAIKYMDHPQKWGWLILSLLGFLNGLFCHETGLAFPFYVLCFLWVLRGYSFTQSFQKSLPFWIAAGIYFVFRMKTVSLQSSILENIFLMDINFGMYLATFAKLLVWYFQSLLTLQNIVLIKAVALNPAGMGLWVVGLVVVLFSCGLLAKFVLNARERFAGLWCVIGFLPAVLACFFQYRSGLILEPHWLFVGSMGYFLFLALMLAKIKDFKKGRVLALIVLAWTLWNVKTGWAYNQLWGNEIQYCSRWMAQSPTIYPIYTYLGHAHLKENNFPEAKKYFLQALNNTFFDYEVFNNLGGIAMQEGDWALAKQYFQRALTINPQSSPVHSNLGVVYFNQGMDDQAEKNYKEALFFNPYFVDARKNLTDLYLTQGRQEDARKIYEDGLNIDPFDQDMMRALISIYAQTSQKDKITLMVKRLINISKDSRVLLDVALHLAQAHQVMPALECFEKSLKINPDFDEAYIELGKFFGNLNRFDDATAIWTEGQRRHPEKQVFRHLIDELEDLKRQTQ